MCDYSLHNVRSRPANAGEKLVTTTFPGTMTRGFAVVDNPAVAVCLRPGTELAFERPAAYRSALGEQVPFVRSKFAGTLARFRLIDTDQINAHHDALEFADGKIVLLTRLVAGQSAIILQIPQDPKLSQAEAREHSTRLPEFTAPR
jgi:hypothetical protein